MLSRLRSSHRTTTYVLLHCIMSASRRARLEATRGESESLIPYAIGAAALAAIGVGVWYFLRSRPQQSVGSCDMLHLVF